MTAMTGELLDYFHTGWKYLVAGNGGEAQGIDHLEWAEDGYRSAGMRQADAVRALIVARQRIAGRTSTSDEEVQQLWESRASWGALLLETASTYYPGTPEAQLRVIPFMLPLSYDIGWGLEQKLTTVADLTSAMAISCVNQGQFERAANILREHGERSHPAIATAWMILLERSRRWPDLIEGASALSAPPLLDRDDSPLVDETKMPKRNEALALMGSLWQATAHAHLGNTEAAEAVIAQMSSSPQLSIFPGIAAGSCYLKGLIKRRQGDEKAAQELFGTGLTLFQLPELVRAQSDPSIAISMTRPDLIEQRKDYWDPATEPLLGQVLAAENADSKQRLLMEAQEELDRQIGMVEVKEQIASLKNQVRFAQEMKRRGKQVKERSNHLILSGPPGTGKTTIARVVAKLYCGYGVLPTDKIVEVTRKDLIAKYEGHTTEKAEAKIREALGGVLFIDEAYDLIQDRGAGQSDPFGQEIVTLLLTEMEKYRDNLIVIIAGYEDKLQAFLDVNEGMQSRFKRWIKFSTYKPHELAQIAQVIATSRGALVSDEAVQALERAIVEHTVDVRNEKRLSPIDKAGNGRFMRNVVERAEELREDRLASTDLESLSDDDLERLEPEDLVTAAAEILKRNS